MPALKMEIHEFISLRSMVIENAPTGYGQCFLQSSTKTKKRNKKTNESQGSAYYRFNAQINTHSKWKQ